MQILAVPFKMSLMGFRVFEYIVETNIRVAQVFGEALLRANPVVRRQLETANASPAPSLNGSVTETAPEDSEALGKKTKRQPSLPPEMPEPASGTARLS